MSTPQPLLVGNTARPLVGKTALVTGGSRGIGAAIARAFAAAGADVAIGYSASPDKAQEVVKQITATGQRGFAIKADQSNQSEVTALVEQAAKLFGGKLDILVNNAGVFHQASAFESSASNVDAINRLWAINVHSVATGVRAASSFLGQGGRIINVGSALGQSVPWPAVADYSATKSALISYTKGWARDFAAKGVTVNLLEPGLTNTDMNPHDGPLEAAAKGSPAGRHGTPDEVAAAALFLATPAASFVNGARLLVDGGLSA